MNIAWTVAYAPASAVGFNVVLSDKCSLLLGSTRSFFIERSGSVVADVGTGNGKYLDANSSCFFIGSDMYGSRLFSKSLYLC